MRDFIQKLIVKEKGNKGSYHREDVREFCTPLSCLWQWLELMDAVEMMDGVMETFTPREFLMSW